MSICRGRPCLIFQNGIILELMTNPDSENNGLIKASAALKNPKRKTF